MRQESLLPLTSEEERLFNSTKRASCGKRMSKHPQRYSGRQSRASFCAKAFHTIHSSCPLAGTNSAMTPCGYQYCTPLNYSATWLRCNKAQAHESCKPPEYTAEQHLFSYPLGQSDIRYQATRRARIVKLSKSGMAYPEQEDPQ
jgi:hypothetical protein